MKKHRPWRTFIGLLLLALSLQSCFGAGSSNTNFKQVKTSTGRQLGVNSLPALFKGTIYFTQDHQIFGVDGNRNIRQLTNGPWAYDPAISPDGKWIAFIERYYDNSDLMLMPTAGGRPKILLSGEGAYIPNPPFSPKSTHHWFAQPAWTPDGKNVIFLSDLQKLYDWANYAYGDLGNDFDQAPFLDLQVFTMPIQNPPSLSYIEAHNAVAYASFGDGGNRDPSYRPEHPNQIIYTHYAYDSSRTQQEIQLFMEDPTMIANHPEKHYHPADPGQAYDPGIAITPAIPNLANLQPSFSPDGNSIAYVRRIDVSHMGIYIMPAPENITSDPTNPAVQKRALLPYQLSSLIVSGKFMCQPVWSPDGKALAYITDNNGIFDIWLATLQVNAKTGAYSMKGSPVQLTEGGVDAESRPFWTT